MKEKKVRKAVKAAPEKNLKFKDVKNGVKNGVKNSATTKAKPKTSALPQTTSRPGMKKLSIDEQANLLQPNKLKQFESYVQRFALSPEIENCLLKPENFDFFRIYNQYHCLREKYQIRMIANNQKHFIREFQKKWTYSLQVKMKGERLYKQQQKKA